MPQGMPGQVFNSSFGNGRVEPVFGIQQSFASLIGEHVKPSGMPATQNPESTQRYLIQPDMAQFPILASTHSQDPVNEVYIRPFDSVLLALPQAGMDC